MQIKIHALLMILVFVFFTPKLTGQNLNDSLIAHYCFDGNANDNFGINHCIVFGASLTTDRFGNINSAYSFDGISNYIQMPAKVWIPDNFSVTGWVVEDTLKYFERFFEFGNGVNLQNVFYSFTSENNLSSFTIHDCVNGATYQRAKPLVTFPVNVWKHIGITFNNNTDSVKVYLDGAFWYSGHLSPQTCGGIKTLNYFGKSNFSSNPDELFKGKMDDIRIYNRVLNASEIFQIYNLTSCASQTSISSNFTTSFTNPCDSTFVQFTDASFSTSGAITNWNWNFGDPSSGANNVSTSQNPQHHFTAIGSYNVQLIVQDAVGALDTFTKVIVINSTHTPINITPNSALCIGDSLALTASGASSYVWTPAVGLNTTFGANVICSVLITTTYTITYVDANGCTNSETHEVQVIPYPALSVTKSNDIECGKNSALLSVSGASTYQWTPTSFLSNPNSSTTIASIDTTTTFYVTGFDGTCSTFDSITVLYVVGGGTTIIPNAFSPNGDNVNDCFKVITNDHFLEYYFAIYNRWGQRVFESSDPSICWEGDSNAEPSPVGTYYYYLKAINSCGKIFKKGDITLVR